MHKGGIFFAYFKENRPKFRETVKIMNRVKNPD
jgi:hypothetical protein